MPEADMKYVEVAKEYKEEILVIIVRIDHTFDSFSPVATHGHIC
jgi:hypothetical protein